MAPASRYVHVLALPFPAAPFPAINGASPAESDRRLSRKLPFCSMGSTAAATLYLRQRRQRQFAGYALETKLVILWGHSPTETIFELLLTGLLYAKMKRNGTRFSRGHVALFRPVRRWRIVDHATPPPTMR